MKKGMVATLATVTLIGGLALFWLKKSSDRDALKLRHFTSDEFGAYWPLMSVELLKKLDAFRAELGYPVLISPAPGAIGRPIIGQDDPAAESGAEKSYHNYLMHGEVMAIDVMPVPPHGATATERQRWVDVAKRVGFRGIGLYPDWQPRPGIHLDVRPVSALNGGAVATWAGIKNDQGRQIYVGIERGLA